MLLHAAIQREPDLMAQFPDPARAFSDLARSQVHKTLIAFEYLLQQQVQRHPALVPWLHMPAELVGAGYSIGC